MTEAEVIARLGEPDTIRRHSWGSVSLDYGKTVVVLTPGRDGADLTHVNVSTLVVHAPTLDHVVKLLDR